MSDDPLHELRELSRSQATGEFICCDDDSGEVHIYLQAGRLAWGTSSLQPLEFTRHLRAFAHIEDDSFKQVVAECRKRRLNLGETLVAWGLVTTDDVRAALHHQIAHALGTLAVAVKARTMFLRRARFQEYNTDLTFALELFQPLEPLIARNDEKPPSDFGTFVEVDEDITAPLVQNDKTQVEKRPGTSIQESLTKVMEIEGVLGVAVVDHTNAICLGLLAKSAAFNIGLAAVDVTEVVRAKKRALHKLGLDDNFEEVLMISKMQYDLVQVNARYPDFFMYIALARDQANLPMARMKIAEIERNMDLESTSLSEGKD